MNRDMFELAQRLQKMFNSSPLLQDIYRQQEFISRNAIKMQPIYDAAPIAEVVKKQLLSFDPIIQAILEQQENINRSIAAGISDTFSMRNLEIQEVISKMIRIPNLKALVPDIVYPRLDELVDTIQKAMPEGEEESPTNVALRRMNQLLSDKILTWETLKWFISLVASVVVALYIAEQSSEQAERHHQQKMEQTDQHHREIIELSARSAQANLDQEERQRNESMEMFAQFLEFIESSFPNDQDNSEIETEAPETPE